MKNVNWGTVAVVVGGVMFWICFSFASFKAGGWVEMERQISDTDSLRTEIATSNAKIRTMEATVDTLQILAGDCRTAGTYPWTYEDSTTVLQVCATESRE